MRGSGRLLDRLVPISRSLGIVPLLSTGGPLWRHVGMSHSDRLVHVYGSHLKTLPLGVAWVYASHVDSSLQPDVPRTCD